MAVPSERLDQRHPLLDRVALRIREVRESTGKTQEDAATAIGTAVKNYQRIEGGRQNLTLSTLARLADAFGVDVGTFFLPPDGTRSRRRR